MGGANYHLPMCIVTASITLPPYSQTGIAFSGNQSVRFSVDSFIKANIGKKFGVNNIVSAKISSYTLALQNPTDATNFANFKSCSGSFHTQGNQEDFGVNISNNPDDYSSTLSMPVDTTEELKGYLMGGNQFTCSVGGSLRRPTKDSIHCIATVAFNIKVE